jgi:hypothetical protein
MIPPYDERPDPMTRNVLPRPAATPRTVPESEVSPAGEALNTALAGLRAAERAAEAAARPVTRLEALIADEAAAEALMAELDAGAAAAMAKWAETGQGAAPEPFAGERKAAESALAAARIAADAARHALTAARQTAAGAGRDLDAARARIAPAVASALREDGARLRDHYWRLAAELEGVRRRLAALDQVLIADFPVVHAQTGRTVVAWMSPDRIPAAEAMRALTAACAGLDSPDACKRAWRAQAGRLAQTGAPASPLI